MKFMRVGEPGRERAAVVAPDGSIRRLPQAFGDFDAGFWIQRRSDTVRRLLDDVPFLRAGDVVELEIDGLGTQRSVLGQA